MAHLIHCTVGEESLDAGLRLASHNPAGARYLLQLLQMRKKHECDIILPDIHTQVEQQLTRDLIVKLDDSVIPRGSSSVFHCQKSAGVKPSRK